MKWIKFEVHSFEVNRKSRSELEKTQKKGEII